LAIAIADTKTLKKIHDAGVAKHEVEVDLTNQEIIYSKGCLISKFEVDAYTKHCLINGLDDISNTLESEEKIYNFEIKQKTTFPWLFNRIKNLQPPRSLGLNVSGAKDVSDW
jgi:3-isopropylmalate dehydratase